MQKQGSNKNNRNKSDTTVKGRSSNMLKQRSSKLNLRSGKTKSSETSGSSISLRRLRLKHNEPSNESIYSDEACALSDFEEKGFCTKSQFFRRKSQQTDLVEKRKKAAKQIDSSHETDARSTCSHSSWKSESSRLSQKTRSVKHAKKFFEERLRHSMTVRSDTTAAIAYRNRERFTKRYNEPKRANPNSNLNQFALMRTIGKGSFGRVILVHHKHLEKFFALKVMSKEKLVKGKQVHHTINERNVLYACNHSNIIKFYGSFKDSSYVYFIMKLYCYGDLYTLMKAKKKFEENDARFYAANIFLAFEYLHINNVLYRDLKPENVLLSSNGYLKLTDFGFAKRINDNQLTTTMCGTPDYLSPE
jgi:hypothetical protein